MGPEPKMAAPERSADEARSVLPVRPTPIRNARRSRRPGNGAWYCDRGRALREVVIGVLRLLSAWWWALAAATDWPSLEVDEFAR